MDPGSEAGVTTAPNCHAGLRSGIHFDLTKIRVRKNSQLSSGESHKTAILALNTIHYPFYVMNRYFGNHFQRTIHWILSSLR
jgi:hypothetical protein